MSSSQSGRGGWFTIARYGSGIFWYGPGAGDEVINDSFFGAAEAGDIVGTGDITASVAVVAGVGIGASFGSGALTATAAVVAGIGDVTGAAIVGSGALVAAGATAAGVGVGTSIGTGALAANAATITGIGAVTTAAISGIGALAASAAIVAGEGTVSTLVRLRPDGDSVLDGWTDQAGGTTNIVQSIDEASANDADYVQSPEAVGTDADLKVRLFDGTTQIVEWTHTDIADEFADAVQTLTAPQSEAISDFANLIVELDDNQGNVYRFSLGNPPGGVAQPVKVKYRYKKLAA